MWVELMVCSYAGLACLARANHRFHALPLIGNWVADPGRAMLTGALLLGAASLVAVRGLGTEQGIVALVLAVSVAGIPLVLLLSVRPRGALAITVPLLLPGSRHRHRPT